MIKDKYIRVERIVYDEVLKERNLLRNNLSDLVIKEKESYISSKKAYDDKLQELEDFKSMNFINRLKFLFRICQSKK